MGKTNKQQEEETKIGLVLPALEKKGWSYDNKNVRFEKTIHVQEQITDGKVILQKEQNKIKRGNPKYVDIVLYARNDYPLAVIEVESSEHTVNYGLNQALEYAKQMDVRFAYSTNGKGFVEYDFYTGKTREFNMDSFPSREELYERYCNGEQLNDYEKEVTEQKYYFKEGLKKPRYYQRIAVNRTVEYISKLKDNPEMKRRLLLVMATGTGKTFTAFQIIYRLYQAGVVKKVLYLADRNFLIDQTIVKEFQYFKDRNILTKVTNKKLDSSYAIYMSLYQQLAGEDNLEPFRQFKPDFFDLIVVDECHRGSVKENSKWRDVLNYFSGAIHIGMTATPKETEDVSNSEYFGEPLYTYSLKQGINDGFLAPYTVRRVFVDRDIEGYTPEPGKLDVYGNEIEHREYTVKDYDRKIIIDERTKLVAKRITEYLKTNNDRYAKTIVFCVDTEHAERMATALRNENADMCKLDYRYVMQITGNNQEGKAQLDNFLDDNSRYPTIVTTSQLLSTGLDCRMCKVIVFDKEVQSMTEFKQMIGRGTRLEWNKGKRFFSILDFRDVTKKFKDKEFDGPASSIFVGSKEPFTPTFPDYDDDVETIEEDEEGKFVKYRVNDVDANIVAEQELLYGPNGELISNPSEHFKKTILEKYPNYESFKRSWDEGSKTEIINSFVEMGVDIGRFKCLYGDDVDVYDIILKVAYDMDLMRLKPERAEMVKNNAFYDELTYEQKQIVDVLLDVYIKDEDDVLAFEDNVEILNLPLFHPYGGLTSIVKKIFGNKNEYFKVQNNLISALYEE